MSQWPRPRVFWLEGKMQVFAGKWDVVGFQVQL